MSGSRILARAPSNIALIKYMGKLDGALNLPANGSLSMTLDSLSTRIELREANARGPSAFVWIPERPAEAPADSSVPALSEEGRLRYLKHAERVARLGSGLLSRTGIPLAAGERTWEIRTSNNFPSDSGIASSASSFAALTLAVTASAAKDPAEFDRALGADPSLRSGLAEISRQGSGSSCRSFEGPWVEWQGVKAAAVSSILPEMVDLVLIAGESKKEVSSSEAHRRVTGSPLWIGRPVRADARLARLKRALESAQLGEVSTIAWEETWEMHSLFHTSAEPFTYWEPRTLALLKWLAPRIRSLQSARAAIVTLDAGPNVHLIVPAPEAARWKQDLHSAFPDLRILEDRQGRGASLLGLGSDR